MAATPRRRRKEEGRTCQGADYVQFKARWLDTGREVLPEEWASARAVRGGEAVVGQLMEIERFDGGRACVLNSAAPIFDERGAITGCAVAIQDVSRRVEAERALERSEEALRAANDELEAANAGLRQSNETLEARVAERTAELNALNQSLESFVYSVSHDLKTPLRGIEGYSRLLEADYADRLDDEGRLFIVSDPAAHLLNRDLVSDRPGRSYESVGGARHAIERENDPRHREAIRFARRIARRLDEARRKDEFEQLIVVAGPAFLGLMREEMSRPTRARVVHEVHNDLVHSPVDALRRHLPASAAELTPQ